jgi:hypothetical protein
MLADQKLPGTQTISTPSISIQQTGLKTGLLISVSLIVYFMIMKYFNFIYSAGAWSFNFVFLFGGIVLTYRYYRMETKLNVDYLPGIALGCITTAASVIPFTLFIYIYFLQVNPSLLVLLKDNILFMGEEITPMRAAVATFVEGISSGVIISFIMMQYYRSGFRRTRGEKLMHG